MKFEFDAEKCSMDLGYKYEGLEEVVAWAQGELEEYLKTCPKMRCRCDDEKWAADEHSGFARATHKAVLFNLEEIK